MNESMTSPIILIFWLTHFNPRSYERSDISRKRNQVSSRLFQSTLLRKERHGGEWVLEIIDGFQSTLLRKERRFSYAYTVDMASFNPRSYERSDRVFFANLFCSIWFQSTLLRKERLFKNFGLDIDEGFNPRSYERSDMIGKLQNIISAMFQSTLLRKERHGSGLCDNKP